MSINTGSLEAVHTHTHTHTHRIDLETKLDKEIKLNLICKKITEKLE